MEGIKQEIKTEPDHWMREWSTHDCPDVPEWKCKIEGEAESGDAAADLQIGEDEKCNIELLANNKGIRTNNQEMQSSKEGSSQPITTLDDVKSKQVFSDRVGNFCKFQCPTCKMQFGIFYSLRAHTKKRESCQKDTAERCLVSAMYYTCRLCGKSILNDYGIVHSHVRGHYGIKNIREYCSKFNVERVLIKRKTLDKTMEESLSQTESNFSETTGTFCRFKCATCFCLFKHFQGLRNHEESSGRKNGSIEQKVVKLTWHKCRLCENAVMCDPFFVNKHLADIHRFKLSDYLKKFRLRNRTLRNQENEEMDKLLEGADIYENVGNLCKFVCPGCPEDETFFSLYGLNKHLQRTSHGPKIHAPLRAIKIYARKLVAHRCCICYSIVPCDQSILVMHVSQLHKITLGAYCKQFGLHKYANSIEVGNRISEKQQEEKNVSDTLENRCRFKCPFCKEEFTSWTSMSSHLRRTENVQGTKGYLNKCISKLMFYKCKLCGSKILCDGRMFTLHLEQSHKGNRRKYEDNFIKNQITPVKSIDIGDLCEFTCLKCKKIMKSWSKMKVHLKRLSHGPIKFDSTRKLMTKYTLHECRLCQRSMLNDGYFCKRHMTRKHNLLLADYAKQFGIKLTRDLTKPIEYKTKRLSFIKEIPSYPAQKSMVVAKGFMPKAKLTKDIGNLCTFKCTLCKQNKEMSCWSTVMNHLHKIHGATITTPFDHKFLNEARYHECLICSSAVLCDNFAIGSHARRHRMKLREYQDLVEKNGGKRLLHFNSHQGKKSQEKRAKPRNETSDIVLKPCFVRLKRLVFL